MANRIKGITVEIGGDTTKLQTALQGVNKEIKNTQAQLKDVEKLLKLDPGNTELLAQKHKLLGQAVEETKNKLQTLAGAICCSSGCDSRNRAGTQAAGGTGQAVRHRFAEDLRNRRKAADGWFQH